MLLAEVDLCDWLLRHDSVLGTLFDELLELLTMLDPLVPFILHLEFIKKGRMVDFVPRLLKTLLSVHAGHLSRLVHLVAHDHLVVELRRRRHRALHLLLLQRLTHVLSRLRLDIFEV